LVSFGARALRAAMHVKRERPTLGTGRHRAAPRGSPRDEARGGHQGATGGLRGGTGRGHRPGELGGHHRTEREPAETLLPGREGHHLRAPHRPWRDGEGWKDGQHRDGDSVWLTLIEYMDALYDYVHIVLRKAVLREQT
jgi:hypothetical protein